MTDELPTVSITTHSILYMNLFQLCTVCGDVPEQLKEQLSKFDIENDKSSKDYTETTRLIEEYLK